MGSAHPAQACRRCNRKRGPVCAPRFEVTKDRALREAASRHNVRCTPGSRRTTSPCRYISKTGSLAHLRSLAQTARLEVLGWCGHVRVSFRRGNGCELQAVRPHPTQQLCASRPRIASGSRPKRMASRQRRLSASALRSVRLLLADLQGEERRGPLGTLAVRRRSRRGKPAPHCRGPHPAQPGHVSRRQAVPSAQVSHALSR